MGKIKQVIVNKTVNGIMFKCLKCNLIHIEFKNLSFNFTQEQYNYFAKYMLNVNGEEWEYKNRNTIYTRKIHIPLGHENYSFRLNNDELTEFKQLLMKQTSGSLKTEDINTSRFNFSTYLN